MVARCVPDVCPSAPDHARATDARWVQRCYEIAVVTPLFGGGPAPGTNDPVTLIRGPSIRGQLRFWWRAARGAAFADVAALRRREGEIWGTAEAASPVTLWVSDEHRGPCRNWAEYEQDRKRGGVNSTPSPVDRNYNAYALFPFQGKAEIKQGLRTVAEQPAMMTQSASFRLHLRWPATPDVTPDVEAAIWAWVNFGGLGARTRRGCGTLYCRDFAPTASDMNNLAAWYTSCLEKYGVNTTAESRPWPVLGKKPPLLLHRRGVSLSPPQAWCHVINTLQDFRQGNVGRGGSGKRAGRSFWPEADSLRRITGQSLPTHKCATTTEENAFPRAEFGLPIIFHFKDSDERNPQKEPADCLLLPSEENGRMASPLILKALACGSNAALPMILRLKTPRLEKVVVIQHGKDNKGCFGSEAIRRPDLATYKDSPMARRSPTGSALEAFLQFAREEGYK